MDITNLTALEITQQIKNNKISAKKVLDIFYKLKSRIKILMLLYH
ncbi:hypothetical protein ACFL4O_03200 [bacterium]